MFGKNGHDERMIRSLLFARLPCDRDCLVRRWCSFVDFVVGCAVEIEILIIDYLLIIEN